MIYLLYYKYIYVELYNLLYDIIILRIHMDINKIRELCRQKKIKWSIHVVIGYDIDNVYIITAYYPNTDKFEDDLKTRKEQ